MVLVGNFCRTNWGDLFACVCGGLVLVVVDLWFRIFQRKGYELVLGIKR